jgi:hypothetical protein
VDGIFEDEATLNQEQLDHYDAQQQLKILIDMFYILKHLYLLQKMDY